MLKGLRKIIFAVLSLFSVVLLTLNGKMVSYDSARAIVMVSAIYMIANLFEHVDIPIALEQISEIAKAVFLRSGNITVKQDKEKNNEME